MHGSATLVPLAGRGFASVATIHNLVAFLYIRNHIQEVRLVHDLAAQARPAHY